jgi:hypothetical protein
MLVLPRFNLLPGLWLTLVLLAVALGFGTAFLSLVGGTAELTRVVELAGPLSALLVLGGLGLLGLIAGLLGMSAARRTPPPLLVAVGLALVPWLLGIASTQETLEQALGALPVAGSGDVLAALAEGTSEAMVARLLGSWMSAALLVGVAVGLGVLRLGQREQSGLGLGLGAALSLVLAGIALLVALEAHQLFNLMTELASARPEVREATLAAGTADLSMLRELRSAAVGMLAVLALALVCWQLFEHPRAIRQWAGSLLLATLAAALLVMDARPLRRAQEEARAAGLPTALLKTLEQTPTLGVMGLRGGRTSP